MDGESHNRSPHPNDFSKTLYFRFAAQLMRVLMAMALMPVLGHNVLTRKNKEGGMMKVNIFEGARRISLLIGALWVVGWSAHAIFSEPYSQVTYSVLSLGVPFVAEDCPDRAAIEFLEREAPDGKSVNIKLCFLAGQADNGEMLVPYTEASDGIVWMGERYSTEVQKYTESVARKFQLTPEGIEAFEAIQRKALLEQWGVAAMSLFGGLAIGWAVVAVIGWIVRGFMGIPRGQDMRPVS